MSKVKVLIISGYGINCEKETALAFSKAGAQPIIMHINALIANQKKLAEFQAIVIPGGFAYGDHIASGKMMANKIIFYLLEEFKKFIQAGWPVMGICNGFQILVKTGLLPNISKKNEIEVTLIDNQNNAFINQWSYLKKSPTNHSFWLKHLEKLTLPLALPIRHGEGKFFTKPATLKEIADKNVAALIYSGEDFSVNKEVNPNGSLLNIAGLTNEQGNVFGLMPHPEAFHAKNLAPHYLQSKIIKEYKKFPFLKKEDGLGMIFFYNVVDFLKKN